MFNEVYAGSAETSPLYWLQEDKYLATIGLESIRWEKLYTDKLKTKFKVLGLCGKNSNMATLTTLNAHRKNRIKVSKVLSPDQKRLKLSQTNKPIQTESV